MRLPTCTANRDIGYYEDSAIIGIDIRSIAFTPENIRVEDMRDWNELITPMWISAISKEIS